MGKCFSIFPHIVYLHKNKSSSQIHKYKKHKEWFCCLWISSPPLPDDPMLPWQHAGLDSAQGSVLLWKGGLSLVFFSHWRSQRGSETPNKPHTALSCHNAKNILTSEYFIYSFLAFVLLYIFLHSLISLQLSMLLTVPDRPAAASKSSLVPAHLERPTFSQSKI